MQQSDSEYRQWLTEVYLPYRRKQLHHRETLHKVGILADKETRKQIQIEDAIIGQLIGQLVNMYRFASSECDASNALRKRLLGNQALSRFANQLNIVRHFLARYNRSERYNLPINDIRLQTFESAQGATIFCSRLRKGLQKEISASLRKRLETFLASVPIGGQEHRTYDVQPLLRFAIERRLETLTPADIYEHFVAAKIRDAAAEINEKDLNQHKGDDVETSVHDLEKQFELLATRSNETNQHSLTESALRLPLSEKRVLTKGNRLCVSACKASKTLGRSVCDTKPYRSYGFVYDWDYC